MIIKSIIWTATAIAMTVSTYGAAVVSSVSVPVVSDSQVIDLIPAFVLSVSAAFGGPSSTVNGVTFGGSFTQGGISLGGTGDFGNFGGRGSGVSGLSAALTQALSISVVQVNSASTLSFSGLTSGQAYTLQIFAAYGPSSETVSDGASSGILTYGQGGSNASYLLDSFTAPSSGIETLSFTTLTGTGAFSALNLEVGSVPEPSSYVLMLGGLMVLGFCVRRRLA